MQIWLWRRMHPLPLSVPSSILLAPETGISASLRPWRRSFYFLCTSHWIHPPGGKKVIQLIRAAAKAAPLAHISLRGEVNSLKDPHSPGHCSLSPWAVSLGGDCLQGSPPWRGAGTGTVCRSLRSSAALSELRWENQFSGKSQDRHFGFRSRFAVIKLMFWSLNWLVDLFHI